jgi:sugar phosphate isomerase/epimerase
MNRRDLVKGLAATAAGVACTALASRPARSAAAAASGTATARTSDGTRLWLGIQFFTIVGNGATVGWAKYSDYLGQIRAIGYDGVELAGFSGYKPEVIRKRTEALGLMVPSVHIGFDQVFDFLPPRPWGPDTFAQAQDVVYSPAGVVQLARLLAGPTRDVGAQFAVIAGGGKANFASVDSTLRFAAALNQANTIARQKGVALSWHPHSIEWAPFQAGPEQGRAPFDVIVANTDASIRYELDIYWSALGSGQTPQETIDHYAPRLALFHLKDMDRSRKIATPGAGGFDFAAIHRAIADHIEPPRYCYVERDGADAGHPIETASAAYRYLRNLGYGLRS